MNLQKEVEAMSLGDIGTVIAPPKAIASISISMLDLLVTKKQYTGIYVTASKPYATVVAQLQKHGVPTNNMFFIDMITMHVSGKANAVSNCYFANAPENVMEIAATLPKVAIAQPNIRFLILDSIATLAMYNTNDGIIKFIHFLTTALRELKMEGIILAPTDQTDPKILDFLHTLSDYVWEDDGT